MCSEIVINASGHKDILRTALTEMFNDKRAEKTGSACHDEFVVLPEAQFNLQR